MFLTKFDTFERVFYCLAEDYNISIVTAEKWDSLTEKKQKKFKRYEIIFQPMSWGAHSKLKGGCFYVDPESNMRVFNYDQYNMAKLCQVVKGWNLTRNNPDNVIESVDPTDEMIKKLHPRVAQYMLDIYEAEVELSGEAEKN